MRNRHRRAKFAQPAPPIFSPDDDGQRPSRILAVTKHDPRSQAHCFLRHTGRFRIAFRSINYCVSALPHMRYPLQLSISDRTYSVTCLVCGVDNAAPDPRIPFRVSYLSLHRKTVFVARNLPSLFPPKFLQTMTFTDHPAPSQLLTTIRDHRRTASCGILVDPGSYSDLFTTAFLRSHISTIPYVPRSAIRYVLHVVLYTAQETRHLIRTVRLRLLLITRSENRHRRASY